MNFTIRKPQSAETISVPTFAQALRTGTGQIIAWEDIHECCCLDVDDITGVSVSDLLFVIRPTPSVVWVSRSGKGLHAIYSEGTMYHADEMAALAVLFLKSRYPQLHRFELLKHTFQPPGQYTELPPTVDTGELDKLLGGGDNDPDAAAHWLESHGMEIGKRYSHAQCPINPTNDAKRDPVIVYDRGVYCHVCNSERGYGWFSFTRLSRSVRYSDFGSMVSHKTHWEHAKYVMRALTELTDRLNERIYSAALVYKHGVEVRTEPVFFPQRNLMRLGRWWGTETGELYNNKIDGLLQGLPVTRFLDEKKKSRIRPDILARLKQTVDLSDIGYPSVDVVRGCKIFDHWMRSSHHAYSIVLQSPLLSKRENEPYRPQYIPEEKRDIDFAWHCLEEPFPGLNRQAIEVLIAAKGIAEGRIGLPPFFYFSGQSGAAKSASALIAAAICGDQNTSVVWTNSVERVRQGIMDGKARGGYVTLNEILKQAAKAGATFQNAMDDILNLTPDSVSHQMYVGPMPLGSLPVMVWTDTEVPNEIRDSVQLSRRLIHVHFDRKVEWEKTIYESGVHQIERLRVASIDYADACNVILSDIIDRFFQYPQDMRAIARQLGFKLLSEETGVYNRTSLMDFYNAVINAPPLDAQLSRMYDGPGWKCIDLMNSQNPLTQVWEIVRDADNPKFSRRCSEANWPEMLGVDPPVEFEIQSHGSKLVVRFRVPS